MCSLNGFCRFGLRRVWSSSAGKMESKSKYHIDNPEIKLFLSPIFSEVWTMERRNSFKDTAPSIQ